MGCWLQQTPQTHPRGPRSTALAPAPSLPDCVCQTGRFPPRFACPSRTSTHATLQVRASSGAAGANAGLFSLLVQVGGQRLQPWPHVTALLRRTQPRAAVAAWPSSAPCCRSTPAPSQLLLGGGASSWRPGSWSRSDASPLCSTQARLALAGFLFLSRTHGFLSLSNTTAASHARAHFCAGNTLASF